MVFGELPDLPHLPELPARGPGRRHDRPRRRRCWSSCRSSSTPAAGGSPRDPGRDLRRTLDLLERDLDQLTEQADGYAGPVKVQAAGPWTLAAAHRPADRRPAAARPRRGPRPRRLARRGAARARRRRRRAAARRHRAAPARRAVAAGGARRARADRERPRHATGRSTEADAAARAARRWSRRSAYRSWCTAARRTCRWRCLARPAPPRPRPRPRPASRTSTRSARRSTPASACSPAPRRPGRRPTVDAPSSAEVADRVRGAVAPARLSAGAAARSRSSSHRPAGSPAHRRSTPARCWPPAGRRAGACVTTHMREYVSYRLGITVMRRFTRGRDGVIGRLTSVGRCGTERCGGQRGRCSASRTVTRSARRPSSSPSPEIEHRYGPTGPRELAGEPALVTDDTQMALAVGWALHEARRRRPRSCWSRCCASGSWPGRSARTTTAPRAAPACGRAPRWRPGCAGRRRRSSGSKGCGANMRVTPVGLVPGFDLDTLAGAGPAPGRAHARPPDRRWPPAS